MQSVRIEKIGLLGASSLVGQLLTTQLQKCGKQIHAFSRQNKTSETDDLIWHLLSAANRNHSEIITDWLCVAPIWILKEYFTLLESYSVRRIVTLSSTSRFTKAESSSENEKSVVALLIDGEEKLKTWAASKGIEWVILRPTLIYGCGQDKNISEIVRFIRQFGFFPLLGKANGLRQPIHARDVAAASFAALQSSSAINRAYNISGKETLPYRAMVKRVFAALHRSPLMLTIPCTLFNLAVICMRLLPRYQHWSVGVAMAERMNSNLVFEHSEAIRDFGFNPQPFQLSVEDLPA